MKQFRVFRHPGREFEGVKVGVSWPAGFFSVFWMLAKQLWSWAGFWIGVALVLTLLERVADSVPGNAAKVFWYSLEGVGWRVTGVIPWREGNNWRAGHLMARGYEVVAVIEAQTPQAAIKQVARRGG